MNINDLIKKVEHKLNEERLNYVDIKGDYLNDEYMNIAVEIHWGDWKHEHLRCDYILAEMGGENIGEDIIEEDGSDCYSARHYFAFNVKDKDTLN